MGDESIIEAASFSLRGLPQVAKAVRRVRASGARVEIRRLGDIPHEERRQLRDLANAWRNGEERRLLYGSRSHSRRRRRA